MRAAMHDTQPASEALCSVSLPELIRLCHPSQPDAFFFLSPFPRQVPISFPLQRACPWAPDPNPSRELEEKRQMEFATDQSVN